MCIRDSPKTVQDQIALDNHKIANNLSTQAKLLVEYNKDLTVEEAEAIVQENKQKNEKLSLFDRVRQEAQGS